MVNSIYPSPNFSQHRLVDNPAAEATDLDALLASLGNDAQGAPVVARMAAHAKGWDSVDGYVEMDGGAAPTVTLQPCMVRKYVVNGNVVHKLVPLTNTAALSSGGGFSVAGINQGRILMRIHAVTGAPTQLRVMLAGGARANEGSL